MVALVALRLPVLGFCLCQNDLVLNSGTCCSEPESHLVQGSCGSCKECSANLEPAPCDDCVVVLSLDPGDFIWSATQFSPAAPSAVPLAAPAGSRDDVLLKSQVALAAGPIRESPPPGSSPLSMRTQVLRL